MFIGRLQTKQEKWARFASERTRKDFWVASGSNHTRRDSYSV